MRSGCSSAPGYAVVIVTNQAGVARGLFDEAFVQDAHARLDERLRAAGARGRRVLLLSAPPRRHRRSVSRWRASAGSRRRDGAPGGRRRWISTWHDRSSLATNGSTSGLARERRRARRAGAHRLRAATKRVAPAGSAPPRSWTRCSTPLAGSSATLAAARGPRWLADRRTTCRRRRSDWSRSLTASVAPRRRDRRPHGRRVHLRPRRARLARGAGPDPPATTRR